MLNRHIVDVGGFLGTGDHYVVVRPSAISFNAKDDKWPATMNANADRQRVKTRNTRIEQMISGLLPASGVA
jgi:hypothetical protein